MEKGGKKSMHPLGFTQKPQMQLRWGVLGLELKKKTFKRHLEEAQVSRKMDGNGETWNLFFSKNRFALEFNWILSNLNVGISGSRTFRTDRRIAKKQGDTRLLPWTMDRDHLRPQVNPDKIHLILVEKLKSKLCEWSSFTNLNCLVFVQLLHWQTCSPPCILYEFKYYIYIYIYIFLIYLHTVSDWQKKTQVTIVY